MVKSITESVIRFDEVVFDKNAQTMTIINGTEGTYAFQDLKSCKILNERAKYHKKEEPFSVTVATSPLPVGLFTERSFFVGIKIMLKDDSVLAIYTSDVATTNNTDLHKKDTREAEKIKAVIDQIINEMNQ